MSGGSPFGEFERYTSHAKQLKTLEEHKYVVDMPIEHIQLIIRYLLTADVNRHFSQVINNVVYKIDPTIWKGDGQGATLNTDHKYNLFMFLRNLSTWHLTGMRNVNSLMVGANESMSSDSKITFKDFNFDPKSLMDKGELKLCEETITMYANNLYLLENANKLTGELTKAVVTQDITTRKAAIDKANAIMENMQREQKRNKPSANKGKSMLSFDDFNLSMAQTRNEMFDNTRKLRTGYAGFNAAIGGDLEGGNVYLIAGPAGTGKSLFVQNLAFSIRKNNPEFKVKNPEKTPVIVYLSQENTMKQINQRTFFMMAGSTNVDPASISDQDIAALSKKSGFCPECPTDIHVCIEYVPNRSIDTSYLYSMYEELYDEGYEMICLIQDHVKRIRSEEKTTDIRIELGNVINEFKVFAGQYDIPIIVLCHTNRAGNSKVEVNETKYDLVKNYTRDTVGESLLMVDNADWFGTICTEYSLKWGDRKWVGLNVSKSRTSDSSNNTVYIPFEHKDSLLLEEDINLPKPTWRQTLNPNTDENGNMFGQSAIGGKPNPFTMNNNGFDDKEAVDKMMSESKSGSVNMSKKKKPNKRAMNMFETELIHGSGKATTEGVGVTNIFDTINNNSVIEIVDLGFEFNPVVPNTAVFEFGF